MTERSLFMTEEEYKAEIYELFTQFDYDTPEKVAAGEEVPIDRQTIDFALFKMIFKALDKPIDGGRLKIIEKKCSDAQLNGVNYPMFENIYLSAFPYETNGALDEALDVLDTQRTGYITIDDMKRVLSDMKGSFTDEDLADLVKTYGKDGRISIAAVRDIFC